MKRAVRLCVFSNFKYFCTMIFYFSGTGNSHWAATLLGKHLNERIVSISELTETDTTFVLEKDEIVGFVFPVHGWRVPRIVSDFMQTLEFKEGNFQNKNSHYTFCLLTAGDSIGRTMERFVSELKEVKTETTLELNAVEAIIMPESYVGLPGMNVDKPEKELKKIKSAEKVIDRFASIVDRRDFSQNNLPLGWKNLKRGPIPDFFSGPVGSFFTRFLITDKPFKVESKKCIRCGICAKVCPVEDIDGGKGKTPIWKNNKKCLTCFACYHHCPSHAIEYGNRTKHKGQYFFGRRER